MNAAGGPFTYQQRWYRPVRTARPQEPIFRAVPHFTCRTSQPCVRPVFRSAASCSDEASTSGRERIALQCWDGRRKGWGSSFQRLALRRGKSRRERPVDARASADALVPLGLDFLTFLAATVLVIPVFKSVKASPVLGFLFSGLVLGQLGLFRNTEELEKLSELGVLFLLFEMGLELSLDRLKALAKFAFGLGTVTMLISTVTFTALGLPVGHGIGTEILVRFFNAPLDLAAIRSLDEAVVIGAALSLSSSAFVLQLLQERGQLATNWGSATLGILLLQDIAVVPFLVLLPVVETVDLAGQSSMDLISKLAPTAALALGGLGLLLLGGRIILRRIFEMVADSRSDETFVALCLLTVTGASLCTQKLGFSDTLGAFVAGVLLAETNYRLQVEADIRPFRGILLGLFFVTTGASLDLQLLFHEWRIVVALLIGLLAVKIGIIGGSGLFFGLTRSESVRTGFMLAQGGEFAFVLLSLAKELKVLPDELNRLLIIVVVLSMALTPLLADLGQALGEYYRRTDREVEGGAMNEALGKEDCGVSPIVICGFGELGQTVANMLESPLARTLGDGGTGCISYVAFDLQPARVKAAREMGFNVQYGDAARPLVIHAAGVDNPRALAVVYTARGRSVGAVQTLREGFPTVPIYARALDSQHAAELKAAGATSVVTANVEAGLELTSNLLESLGAKPRNLSALTEALRTQFDVRSTALSRAITDGGGHDGPSSSDNDVFKLNEDALPQEARGYFDDIFAVGTAFLTGEWGEDIGDPVARRDQLKEAYAVAPPQPDAKVLEALRDGNGPRAALPPPGPSMTAGSTGTAVTGALGQQPVGSGPTVVNDAASRERGSGSVEILPSASPAAALLSVNGASIGNGAGTGKGGAVENGIEKMIDGDGNKRDLSWYVSQNLSLEERDGVTECPIDKTPS